MIYQGENLHVTRLEQGIAELVFDSAGSVNKFDQQTLQELSQALNQLSKERDLKALLVSSNKPAFIVGADITEFTAMFSHSDEELKAWVDQANHIFTQLEDLPFPTLSAMRGQALGGGCECLLATDLRVGDTSSQVGLPEVKLGIIPGFGGTVRLPRLIGADNAMELITTGKTLKAEPALKLGLLDAVVPEDKLREAALGMLQQAIDGQLDWRARREEKKAPLQLSRTEMLMSFSTAKGMVAAKAGPHYPAPMAAVRSIEKGAALAQSEALACETAEFIKVAKSETALSLITIFLNDQYVKSLSRKASKHGAPTHRAAVLGAGIMGGGIAYQSASKGVPVVMKDIRQDALDLGLNEASKLLNKQLDRGRINGAGLAKVLSAITPALSYDALVDVDTVVEAVVEDPKIKGLVLKELEQKVSDDTVLTSNTSTIPISLLAKSLERPERFCGMHFFNPVHRMPLVEVIRGEQTSEETVQQVVAYAHQMGKTPVVVNDCPGFFVNRVLFPYFQGFSQLLSEGVDFAQIDKVMEKQFGWPMGPAYLLDVVGLDTAHHGREVMAQGYPDRMGQSGPDAIDALYESNRLGQKNGVGFYQHSLNKRGKPVHTVDDQIKGLLSGLSDKVSTPEASEIINKMMIPMLNECVRCLDEGIVATPMEADLAVLFGLGFPPFRGGPLRYIDSLGLDKYIEQADALAHLGAVYQVPQRLRDMASKGQTFYPSH